MFDINHNGVVDELDMLLVSVPGDLDDDADVDLADFASFQKCFAGTETPFDPLPCGLADLDTDGDVDVEDAQRFEAVMTGPDSE